MKLLLSFLFIFCSLSSCVIDDDDRDIPRRERRERRGPRADRDTTTPAGDTNPSPAVSPGGVAAPSPGGSGGSGRPVGSTGGPTGGGPGGLQPGSQPPATAPEKDSFFSPIFDSQHTSISLSLTPDPDAVPHTKVTMLASPKEHPLQLVSGQSGSVLWIHSIGDKKVISIRFPDFDKILYFELKTSATEVLVFQGKELSPGTPIAKTREAFVFYIQNKENEFDILCIKPRDDTQRLTINQSYEDHPSCSSL